MIIIWLICGLVGAGWMLSTEWKDNQSLSIEDLILATVVIIMGPVVLIVGSINWLEQNGSKIIIKRRKNDV